MVLKEHMGDAQESIGDIHGRFEQNGCLGHQDGVQMHGGIQSYWGYPEAPNIWGCQVIAPKGKSYMPLKKNRGV